MYSYLYIAQYCKSKCTASAILYEQMYMQPAIYSAILLLMVAKDILPLSRCLVGFTLHFSFHLLLPETAILWAVAKSVGFPWTENTVFLHSKYSKRTAFPDVRWSRIDSGVRLYDLWYVTKINHLLEYLFSHCRAWAISYQSNPQLPSCLQVTNSTASDDFLSPNVVVIFDDGATTSNAVFSLLNDNLPEGNETFLLEITFARLGAEIGAQNTMTLVITANDEPHGQLGFSQVGVCGTKILSGEWNLADRFVAA